MKPSNNYETLWPCLFLSLQLHNIVFSLYEIRVQHTVDIQEMTFEERIDLTSTGIFQLLGLLHSADLWYIFHLPATLFFSLMPIHSSDCVLYIASHFDGFSSWTIFLTTMSVLCVFPRAFDDTLCFIILQVITGWCHLLLPCWGLSVKASLRFFSLFSTKAPATIICLLESLDLKYVFFNKWKIEAMNGIYSEIAEFAHMMLHVSTTAFHDVMLPKSQLINREI